MLTKETKDKLIKLGLNVEELETAIKADDEKTVKVPEGTLFNDESLTARDNNKIEEGKKLGIIEGKTAGFEIANKVLISKFGLKDVKKDDAPEKVAEAITATIAGGDSGLKSQISELQKSVTDWESKYTGLEKEKQTIERNTQLLSILPKNRKSVLTDSEYLSLLSNNIEDMDGKLAVKLNGEVIRHEKTKDILPINEAIAKVFEARSWVEVEAPPAGGRGGKDTGGSGGKTGIKTLSEAKKSFTDETGKDPLNVDFATYLSGIVKDNQDFDYSK